MLNSGGLHKLGGQEGTEPRRRKARHGKLRAGQEGGVRYYWLMR